jgi:hypothetical protein
LRGNSHPCSRFPHPWAISLIHGGLFLIHGASGALAVPMGALMACAQGHP